MDVHPTTPYNTGALLSTLLVAGLGSNGAVRAAFPLNALLLLAITGVKSLLAAALIHRFLPAGKPPTHPPTTLLSNTHLNPHPNPLVHSNQPTTHPPTHPLHLQGIKSLCCTRVKPLLPRWSCPS